MNIDVDTLRPHYRQRLGRRSLKSDFVMVESLEILKDVPKWQSISFIIPVPYLAFKLRVGGRASSCTAGDPSS